MLIMLIMLIIFIIIIMNTIASGCPTPDIVSMQQISRSRSCEWPSTVWYAAISDLCLFKMSRTRWHLLHVHLCSLHMNSVLLVWWKSYTNSNAPQETAQLPNDENDIILYSKCASLSMTTTEKSQQYYWTIFKTFRIKGDLLINVNSIDSVTIVHIVRSEQNILIPKAWILTVKFILKWL